MIRANKGGLLGAFWSSYVTRKVRSSFRAVWLRGERPLPTQPTLFYANHSSFWDGFLAHQLFLALGFDGYCVMEEKNLRRYPFLARLGAFSVVRGEGASALASVRHAREIFARPCAAVMLFPEGELKPFGPLRPLSRGIELFARAGAAMLVPVAMRLLFLESEKPDALIELGAPHGFEEVSGCGKRLGVLVERLGGVTGSEGFDQMVEGKSGVDQQWDRARGLARR